MADSVERGNDISLIIPLQDEEASVQQLLESITSQSRLPDEIVLVDAGSKDATLACARAASQSLPLRIVSRDRVFPGIARNEGVAEARFDWLAFTDAGIVLDAGWLHELAGAAGGEDRPDIVFGGYEPICDTFFKECSALAYIPAKDGRGMRGPSIASCLLRKEAFLATGGFLPFRAAEDLIFIDALRKGGRRTAYAAGAIARWQIAATLRATFSRFSLYSKHNLLAGWGERWHYGLARQYAGLTVLASACWFLVGGWLPSLLVPIFFLARASKAAWVKRHSFSFATLHPVRILGAGVVLMVIDAATLAGAVRYWRGKGSV